VLTGVLLSPCSQVQGLRPAEPDWPSEGWDTQSLQLRHGLPTSAICHPPPAARPNAPTAAGSGQHRSRLGRLLLQSLLPAGPGEGQPTAPSEVQQQAALATHCKLMSLRPQLRLLGRSRAPDRRCTHQGCSHSLPSVPSPAPPTAPAVSPPPGCPQQPPKRAMHPSVPDLGSAEGSESASGYRLAHQMPPVLRLGS